jgi:casein kinase II subunit beta
MNTRATRNFFVESARQSREQLEDERQHRVSRAAQSNTTSEGVTSELDQIMDVLGDNEAQLQRSVVPELQTGVVTMSGARWTAGVDLNEHGRLADARAASRQSLDEHEFVVPDGSLSVPHTNRLGERSFQTVDNEGQIVTPGPAMQRVSPGASPIATQMRTVRHNVRARGSVASSDMDDGSESEGTEEDLSWISWFCSLNGNEFFCEVDEEFIQDDFNLTGLSSMVAYYDYALDMILDVELPDADLDERQHELIELSAECLYGLIHARYILTNRGLHDMLEKFNNVDFGRCPRVYCSGQPVLPVGQSDIPRHSTVKLFCPRCWDLFLPRSVAHTHLDGAFWGTTFPHLFLQTYPELVPERNPERYVPRIFGFRVSEKSKQVQRNLGLLHRTSEPDDPTNGT